MLSINKYFKSSEKLLALKISLIAFLGLVLCLTFLISLNWWYLVGAEKWKFLEDIELFEQTIQEYPLPFLADKQAKDFLNPFWPGKRDFMQKSQRRVVLERLMRDSIIINKSGIVEKMGIFQYIDIEQDNLDNENEEEIFEKEFDEKKFILYRFKLWENEIFFSRDIDYISFFQSRLIINSFLLSIVFFIIIYLVSLQLAHLTIAPIKENNKKLKEYNHNLAHELKTPLSVMGSNLEMFEMAPDKGFISSSKEEIKSMEQIINALLFLSENSIIKDKEKLNFSNLVKEIVSQQETKKKFELELKEKKIFIETDPILLKRLITNLIENAIKYTTDDTIYISLSKKKLSIKNKTNMVLSNEEAKNFLEPFYQFDTSRHSNGYGLGLSIVKRICETFSWEIAVKVEDWFFIVSIDF
jgi:signal transduction histidine kinase